MDQVLCSYILFQSVFLIQLTGTTANSETSTEPITSHVPTESTNVSTTSSANFSTVSSNVPNVFSTHLSSTTNSSVSTDSTSISTKLNAPSLTSPNSSAASNYTFQMTSSPITSGTTNVSSTINPNTKLDTISTHSMDTTFKGNGDKTNQGQLQTPEKPLTITTLPGATPFTSAMTRTTAQKISKNTPTTDAISQQQYNAEELTTWQRHGNSFANLDEQTTAILGASTLRAVTTSTKSDHSGTGQHTDPVPDNGVVVVLSTTSLCALTSCFVNLLL